MAITPKPQQAPANAAKIFYEQQATFFEAVLNVSNEAAALVPNTFERMQTSAGSWSFTVDALGADHICVAAHTLFGKGDITLSSYDTNLDSIEDIVITPENNNPFVARFTKSVDLIEFMEVSMTASAAAEIGYIMTTTPLTMERGIYVGHSPITLSQQTTYQTNISESGQFLGRNIVRQGQQSTYAWRQLTPDWYRANFQPFTEYARELPFFIQWQPDKYPNEIAFGYTTADIQPTNSNAVGMMDVSFNMRAHADT